jgi:hypothetical protein
MAAALTKALGQEVRYNDVPREVYRSFGFPGAEDKSYMTDEPRLAATDDPAPRTSLSIVTFSRVL